MHSVYHAAYSFVGGSLGKQADLMDDWGACLDSSRVLIRGSVSATQLASVVISNLELQQRKNPLVIKTRACP